MNVFNSLKFFKNNTIFTSMNNLRKMMKIPVLCHCQPKMSCAVRFIASNIIISIRLLIIIEVNNACLIIKCEVWYIFARSISFLKEKKY